MYDSALIVLYFAFYAMLGYFGEVLYVRITEKKWVDRSLLDGPFFLLYGVGALLPVVAFTPHSPIWQVVVVSAVYSGVVEYFGSILYEKIGLKIWDYEGQIANIRGRVCLVSVTVFALTSVFIVYAIHPWLTEVTRRLDAPVAIALAVTFVMYICVNGHKKLRGQLKHYRATGIISNKFYDKH